MTIAAATATRPRTVPSARWPRHGTSDSRARPGDAEPAPGPPGDVQVNSGALPEGVSAKDMILSLSPPSARRWTARFRIRGSAARLSMEERMTLCNMSIEAVLGRHDCA
jgi:hypothetical protein